MILVPTSENPQIRKKSVKKKLNKTKQKLIKIQKSVLILYLVWQRKEKKKTTEKPNRIKGTKVANWKDL